MGIDSRNTIDYYNKNALEYYQTTVNGNMFFVYEKFLKYLKPNGYILDFGCGSGRDSKFFLDKGFKVRAVDGSKELCKLASNLINMHVDTMKFMDLKDKECYDAIWACASIQHLPLDDLPTVIHKMEQAVKGNGYIYTSFKDGNDERVINGIYYTYLSISEFESLIGFFNDLEIVKSWQTNSCIENKREQVWNNFILRKKPYKY